jgi:hypothetical protein
MTLAFDLENTARFPVRIDGLAHDMSTVDRYTDLVVLTRANVYSGRWTSFRPFTIQAGEFRTIGFKLTVPSGSACAGGQVGTTAWSVANLRFSFLRVFHRTAFVDMPAVAALVCGKLPRPYDGGY